MDVFDDGITLKHEIKLNKKWILHETDPLKKKNTSIKMSFKLILLQVKIVTHPLWPHKF